MAAWRQWGEWGLVTTAWSVACRTGVYHDDNGDRPARGDNQRTCKLSQAGNKIATDPLPPSYTSDYCKQRPLPPSYTSDCCKQRPPPWLALAVNKGRHVGRVEARVGVGQVGGVEEADSPSVPPCIRDYNYNLRHDAVAAGPAMASVRGWRKFVGLINNC